MDRVAFGNDALDDLSDLSDDEDTISLTAPPETSFLDDSSSSPTSTEDSDLFSRPSKSTTTTYLKRRRKPDAQAQSSPPPSPNQPSKSRTPNRKRTGASRKGANSKQTTEPNVNSGEPSTSKHSNPVKPPSSDQDTLQQPASRAKRKPPASLSRGGTSKRTKISPEPTFVASSDVPSKLPIPIQSDDPFVLPNPKKKWNLEDLDDKVFVLFDDKGEIAREAIGYWWPSQVVSKDLDNRTVTVRPYGNHGLSEVKDICIEKPSIRCVFNWTLRRHHNFIQNAASTQFSTPLELRKRYQEAFDQMERDLGLTNMPLPSSSQPDPALPQSLDQSGATSKFDRARPRDLEVALDTLVPIGEEVLAIDIKDRSKPNPQYWAARIESFEPADPKKPKDYDGYIAEFQTGERQKLQRAWFFTIDQKGFSDCKLGRYDTALPSNHIARNGDAPSRSPTPEPFNPEKLRILKGDKFEKLGIDEQIRYTYPILQLIIRGEYEPALDKHRKFMGGARSRSEVQQTSGYHGGFSEGEMTHILYEVKRWALRDDRRPNAKSQPGAHHIPRPKGDEDYESMTDIDRLSYVTDVLKLQAMIQLAMWREGRRTSVLPMDAGEEKALYAAAYSKLERGNWWINIVKRHENQQPPPPPSTPEPSGRRRNKVRYTEL